jgi:copper(I)-binding protein
MKRRGALLALLIFCTACAADTSITVSEVWSRATPPGSTVGVVYARIVAAQADELLSIATPVAERVEMHVSSEAAGAMTMRSIASAPLPANEPVQFRVGGMHMMLLGLRKPLAAGTTFPLTLQFRAARPVTVLAKVIAPGDPAPGDAGSRP